MPHYEFRYFSAERRDQLLIARTVRATAKLAPGRFPDFCSCPIVTLLRSGAAKACSTAVIAALHRLAWTARRLARDERTFMLTSSPQRRD